MPYRQSYSWASSSPTSSELHFSDTQHRVPGALKIMAKSIGQCILCTVIMWGRVTEENTKTWFKPQTWLFLDRSGLLKNRVKGMKGKHGFHRSPATLKVYDIIK